MNECVVFSVNIGKVSLDNFILDVAERNHRYDENIYEDLDEYEDKNISGTFQFNSDFRKLQFDPTFSKKRETMLNNAGIKIKAPSRRKNAAVANVTPLSNMFASFEASKAKRRTIRQEIRDDRRKELQSLNRDDDRQNRQRRRERDAVLNL
jgi:hypothetical protein